MYFLLLLTNRQCFYQTNDELGNTVERCAKAENKSEEAFSKAEAERTHIKNDLAAVEKDLAVAREELAEAKKTHDVYIHQCNSYRNKLKANAQELQVQEVKCENAKVAETMQAARVSSIHSTAMSFSTTLNKLFY